MRPPFALTLSLDGLTLLHRTKNGWETVGTVALDSGDLDDGMAALRATAETLEPGRVSCKLVLPDDQVRYLAIDAVTDGPEAAEAAALAALDGATPYAVEDLAVDIVQANGALRIAAVARETLGEAEYFARGYGLNPVSFVADPAEDAFAGEPFFGMTHHARDWLAPGETVERDRLGVSAPDPLQSAPRQAPWPAPEPDSAPQGLAEPPADPFLPAPPPVEPATPDEPEAPYTAAPVVFKSRKAASVASAPDAPETPETSEPRMGGASRPRIERPQGIVPADMDAPAAQPEDPPAEPEGPAPTRVADLAESEAAALSTAPPAGQAPRLDAPSHPDAAPVAPPARAPAPERAPHPIAPRGPVDTAPPRPVMAADPGADEALRMTVFGAREAQQQRGKPRYLGLILTALLLIFLAGVAAWATLIADRDTLSALWPGAPAQETPAVAVPALPDPITPPEPVETSEPKVAVVLPPDPAPDTGLTAPVPDAPAPAPVAEVAPETPPGPTLPQPGASQTLNDLFTPELDVAIAAEDALALPPAGSLDTDRALGAIPNPAPAGSQFDLDARGLVVATQDGALAPEGHRVVLGAPPVQPPSIPLRVEPTLESETEAVQARLAAFRPRARPDDLAEQFERSQLAGRLRSELAQIKPLARPPSVQDAEDIDRTQTEFAVVRSPSPVVRPANLRAAAPRPAPAAAPAARAPEPQQVATVAPRTVTPRIPSSASVARRATIDNAINLNRVNLIGVYGSPSNRRALVRLPSGRYKKVKVGDRVDGGRVLAISESELRYQKGSRTVRLRMPRG